MTPTIYRFQPFATDKNIGDVYNAHCRMVPNDDDWIQIMDWDAMLLTREGFNIIDEAVILHPDTDIFGAVTNRIGYGWQRYLLNNDIDFNLVTHIEIAERLSKLGASMVKIETIAGFFMLFKKSYWNKNPFQPRLKDEKGKLFDKNFCRGATDMKLIKGLYVFHQYRATTHENDQSHLE